MIKKFIVSLKTLVIFFWIAVLALSVRWSIVEVYMIPQQGMMPTLFSGDYVIVNKLAYGLRVPFVHKYMSQWSTPKRGDVIVFRTPFNPELLSIRRVIAVPYDRVFFENGDLYINEQAILKQTPRERKKDFFWVRDEDFSTGGRTADKSHYIHWQETLSQSTYSILLQKVTLGYLIFGPYRVPAHHYFVMGDNRNNSQDSRTWPSQTQKAKGQVTFSRVQKKGRIIIPKGTTLRTKNVKWPQYFETQKKGILTGLSVDVDVIAKKAGLAGNILSEEIFFIEDNILSQKINVTNMQNFTEGEDNHLVFNLDVLGRVNRIWFSCKKKLPFISFFCDPRDIRWGRTFFPVYHKGVMK